jgi:hypothetical protein
MGGNDILGCVLFWWLVDAGVGVRRQSSDHDFLANLDHYMHCIHLVACSQSAWLHALILLNAGVPGPARPSHARLALVACSHILLPYLLFWLSAGVGVRRQSSDHDFLANLDQLVALSSQRPASATSERFIHMCVVTTTRYFWCLR